MKIHLNKKQHEYTPQFPNEASRGLYERSGKVKSDSKLVGFIYDLLRDKIPPGEMERILKDGKTSNVNENNPVYYSNGWIANYALDIANRLSDELGKNNGSG